MYCIILLVGNSQDLRLVRQYLEMALPDERFEFLMSAVNEVSNIIYSVVMTTFLLIAAPLIAKVESEYMT